MARYLLGAALGALAGYAWHRLAGCSTGGCPITADPRISTLYGAAVGLALAWR